MTAIMITPSRALTGNQLETFWNIMPLLVFRRASPELRIMFEDALKRRVRRCTTVLAQTNARASCRGSSGNTRTHEVAS